MSFRLTAALAIIAAVLSGCATSGAGQKFQEPMVAPGKSAIYVYRTDTPHFGATPMPGARTAGVAVTYPSIACGSEAAHILSGGCHRFVVTPGPIECAASPQITSSVKINVEAAKTYYVEESLDAGLTGLQVELKSVSAQQAHPWLSVCKEQ